MMGAGFSSVDQVVGFIELSQGNFDLQGWPNFTGAGQKLKLRAQLGSRRTEYELSFVEPWFLNRKLSLGFDVFRTDIDYTDFDLERTGAAISLSKPLPGPNRLTLRYSIEKTVIQDIADTNLYVYETSPSETYLFDSEEDTVKSALEIRLTHDTRNNPFIPTRGSRLVLSGELAGGPLGFDTDLYSLSLRANQYLSLWWNHVLSLRTQWNTVDSYGSSQEVPISERLFAGGGRTLRGYEYRDVGPKVVRADTLGTSDFHRPVGGESMAIASAEYLIPIVSGIRLATFFDIGNVWRGPFEFDISDTASSIGVGLRFDMPGFPIRIDRAWSVDADSPITDLDKWVFWIGYD